MGTLTLIGLGLNPKELPIGAIESIQTASKTYLERYTAPVDDDWINQLKHQTNTSIIEIRRQDLEEGSTIIKESLTGQVVLLSPGDPLVATTHVDLRIRARRAGVEVKVIHASSIITSVLGELGLHIYKIGKIVTATPGPMNTLCRTISANLQSDLHSLILVSELDFPQLVENLTVAGKEIGEDVIHEDTFLLVAMNMGRDDQVLVGGTLDALRKIEFPEGPFTVIITAALHFSEIEALTSVLGLSETEIGDNTKKIKSIPERMLSVYVPKTRKALINAQRLLGSNSRYAALLQNVECYADDAERFLREGRRELAVLSIGYAEGLLDSLRFLGELEITW